MVDSIAISLNGLVMQQDLGLSELTTDESGHCQASQCLLGNKTDASEKRHRIVIEDNLTRAFNSNLSMKNCCPDAERG